MTHHATLLPGHVMGAFATTGGTDFTAISAGLAIVVGGLGNPHDEIGISAETLAITPRVDPLQGQAPKHQRTTR